MAESYNQAKHNRIAHVVSHTHWDREWRYPIWETQLMLMNFMDELVELLETGVYPSFLLDGQVMPVLDYLETRPEMKERVKKLVAAGKLEVGPWLMLPDQYPIDGEALVRNLLLGLRRSEELGGALKLGYTSFGWGQTAQLPQIYDGFGIDLVFVGKKVSKERAPQSEFVWRGADGTELLTTRFGELGRQNFYLYVHLSSLFGVDHIGPEWKYNWDAGGTAFHRADGEQMEQDHFRLDEPKKWHAEFINPELINIAWKTTDESVLADDRLMMNGCDYSSAQPMFPEMLEKIKCVDSDNKWIHTSIRKFADLMREKIDRSKLVTVHGELRDGCAGSVSGNALTTRLYLKQLNKRAQNMLIRFAEPLSMLTAMQGAPLEINLINKAWQYLLESHPHDSINGVTQDKTANDVEYRLNQVIDISQTLGNKALQEIVKRADLSRFKDDDVLIMVFNPLPYARRDVVEAYINMPYDGNMYDYFIKPPDGIQMVDAEGKAVCTQNHGHTVEHYPVCELHTRAFPYTCRRYRVYFDTGEIPACGYKVFKAVQITEQRDIYSQRWSDTHAHTGTLLRSPFVMENEYLTVKMNTNGTFDLTDKATGRIFAGLNYYEDRAEAGNYWINRRPLFTEVHNSQGCAAKLSSADTGPLATTLVSEISITVPHPGNGSKRDSVGKQELGIKTSVTLRAGQKHVEVNVQFDNKFENHYLRVMFPTGVKGATHANAGGHFNVDQRSTKQQGPTPDSTWPDMGTLPHNNFVDIDDGKAGIGFMNDCLTEYEVLDDDERTVALSLLRSVKNWLCTEIRVGSDYPSQKGGQSMRFHSLNYAIMPHQGNWQSANLDLEAEKFNIPNRLVQTRRKEGTLDGNKLSLFSICNPAIRFSALKKCENRDTYLLRIYNPTNNKQQCDIEFYKGISKAWTTDLNEKRLKEITIKELKKISIEIGLKRIVSLELEV